MRPGQQARPKPVIVVSKASTFKPKTAQYFPTAPGGALAGQHVIAGASNLPTVNANRASGGTTTSTYSDKYTASETPPKTAAPASIQAQQSEQINKAIAQRQLSQMQQKGQVSRGYDPGPSILVQQEQDFPVVDVSGQNIPRRNNAPIARSTIAGGGGVMNAPILPGERVGIYATRSEQPTPTDKMEEFDTDWKSVIDDYSGNIPVISTLRRNLAEGIYAGARKVELAKEYGAEAYQTESAFFTNPIGVRFTPEESGRSRDTFTRMVNMDLIAGYDIELSGKAGALFTQAQYVVGGVVGAVGAPTLAAGLVNMGIGVGSVGGAYYGGIKAEEMGAPPLVSYGVMMLAGGLTSKGLTAGKNIVLPYDIMYSKGGVIRPTGTSTIGKMGLGTTIPQEGIPTKIRYYNPVGEFVEPKVSIGLTSIKSRDIGLGLKFPKRGEMLGKGPTGEIMVLKSFGGDFGKSLGSRQPITAVDSVGRMSYSFNNPIKVKPGLKGLPAKTINYLKGAREGESGVIFRGMTGVEMGTLEPAAKASTTIYKTMGMGGTETGGVYSKPVNVNLRTVKSTVKTKTILGGEAYQGVENVRGTIGNTKIRMKQGYIEPVFNLDTGGVKEILGKRYTEKIIGGGYKNYGKYGEQTLKPPKMSTQSASQLGMNALENVGLAGLGRKAPIQFKMPMMIPISQSSSRSDSRQAYASMNSQTLINMPKTSTMPVQNTIMMPKSFTQTVPKTYTTTIPKMMTGTIPKTITSTIPKTYTTTMSKSITSVIPKTITPFSPKMSPMFIPPGGGGIGWPGGLPIFWGGGEGPTPRGRGRKSKWTRSGIPTGRALMKFVYGR